MPLLGKAAVAIYSNYPAEYREEHSRFHSYEHLLERVSTPGFLRGRRCNALGSQSPSVFALYEVSDRDVTVQGPYIDKLNNPTAWTARLRPLADYASRTLCEVVSSTGWGTGSHVLTVRFSPAAGRAEALKAWVCGLLDASFASADTRTAAHFLVRDQSIERPMTEEERICAHGAGSLQSDWLIVVEGWNEAALRALQDGMLSSEQLAAHGADAGATHDLYALSHVVMHEEFEPACAA